MSPQATEASMMSAMEQVWNDTSDPPELIYLPGIGVVRLDSPEFHRWYFQNKARSSVPEG